MGEREGLLRRGDGPEGAWRQLEDVQGAAWVSSEAAVSLWQSGDLLQLWLQEGSQGTVDRQTPCLCQGLNSDCIVDCRKPDL